MFSMDPGSRNCGGHVVVALHGELDVIDAADVAAALETVAGRGPRIIVDLAGLEFIDCAGLAALARGREHARLAGGNLVLAAPHERILRILAIIGPAHGLSVHASVEEAAASSEDPRRVVAMNGAAGLAVPARQPRALAGACAEPGPGIASELSGVPG
jgi:anti-sigma B factor antagonist